MHKAKGNMFPFVDFTWQPVGGHCSHECPYCFMKPLKRFAALSKRYSGPPREIESEFCTDPTMTGKTIFVADTVDLFADDVPCAIIDRVLEHCYLSLPNRYLFLTKNPSRYLDFIDQFQRIDCVLGTTIETLDDPNPRYGKAPNMASRLLHIQEIKKYLLRTFISIEPIMRHDHTFAGQIKPAAPDFIAIGANSGRVRLPEPKWDEVLFLIRSLQQAGIRLYLKSNLARILGKDTYLHEVAFEETKHKESEKANKLIQGVLF
jgi:DNA repair photolyase